MGRQADSFRRASSAEPEGSSASGDGACITTLRRRGDSATPSVLRVGPAWLGVQRLVRGFLRDRHLPRNGEAGGGMERARRGRSSSRPLGSRSPRRWSPSQHGLVAGATSSATFGRPTRTFGSGQAAPRSAGSRWKTGRPPSPSIFGRLPRVCRRWLRAALAATGAPQALQNFAEALNPTHWPPPQRDGARPCFVEAAGCPRDAPPASGSSPSPSTPPTGSSRRGSVRWGVHACADDVAAACSLLRGIAVVAGKCASQRAQWEARPRLASSFRATPQ